MRLLRRIMVFSLIIVIPVLIICLSANMSLRAPDVYQYSLKATEILTEQNIDVEEDTVGELFSDYLLHKISEFQMAEGIEGEEDLIFSKNDQLAIASLRNVLDISAIVAAVFLIFTVVSYIFLIRTDYKEALRWTFRRAAVVVGLLLIALIALYNLTFTGVFIHEHIFNIAFTETDMLPKIMSSSYSKTLLIVTGGICVVLTVASAYATWSMTKPKRMFF